MAFALVVYGDGAAGAIAAAAFRRVCGCQIDLFEAVGEYQPTDVRSAYQFVIVLNDFGSDPVPQVAGRRLRWRLPEAEIAAESDEVATLRKAIAAKIIETRVERWCALCCPCGVADARLRRLLTQSHLS